MNEGQSEFLRCWGVLRKNKWLILGGVAIAVVLTLAVSYLLPPVYESSLIIEVGEVYTPPEENVKQEVKMIEEPMSVVEVLRSRDFLERTRKELGLDVTLEKMEDRLKVAQVVELTRFQRTESPLVKITYEDVSPAITVQVLDSLARQLVSQHTREYQSSVRMLEERIKNLEDKVSAAEKLIARQEEYQKSIQKESALVEAAAAEYDRRLKELNFNEAQRTEALFFKSTLNSMKEQIIELQKEFNESNLAIGEAEGNIQDYKNQAANFRNLIDLTKNSNIRAQPVLPEEPVRPRKLLNTLVAGGLALIVLTVFFLFQEYVRG